MEIFPESAGLISYFADLGMKVQFGKKKI